MQKEHCPVCKQELGEDEQLTISWYSHAVFGDYYIVHHYLVSGEEWCMEAGYQLVKKEINK